MYEAVIMLTVITITVPDDDCSASLLVDDVSVTAIIESG